MSHLERGDMRFQYSQIRLLVRFSYLKYNMIFLQQNMKAFATKMRICNKITFFEIYLFSRINLKSNDLRWSQLFIQTDHLLYRKSVVENKAGRGYKRQKGMATFKKYLLTSRLSSLDSSQQDIIQTKLGKELKIFQTDEGV